eukprot:4915000-Karenia_brevis.AAC.1
MLDADVALIVETHLLKQRSLQKVNLTKKYGWDSTAAPARRSDMSEKGTNAGVMVMAKRHWHNKPLASCVDRL